MKIQILCRDEKDYWYDCYKLGKDGTIRIEIDDTYTTIIKGKFSNGIEVYANSEILSIKLLE